MVCPFCLNTKTEVYNSRPTKKVNSLWRRRRCPSCHQEFTTRETIDAEAILKVQTPDNKSIAFSRARLLLSLLKSCDHQTQQDNAYWLCQTIEQKLIRQATQTEGTVTTEQITTAALAVLKNFDTPSFIKYLTYHSPALDAKTIKNQLNK